MGFVDLDKITDKHIKELNKLNEYIPLSLQCFITDINKYVNGLSNKEKQKFYSTHSTLQRTNKPSEFLHDELVEWIGKHKEFEDIING